MKRNRAALVTSVSTAMLGAGWAAGIVGTAVAADPTLTTTIGAAGTQSPSTGTFTGTSASPSPSASADPSASASASAPATSAPAPSKPSGTFDGAQVKTREGAFQAQIVVDNGAITKVNVLIGGDNRGESVAINRSALPTLQQRVLSAQSWNVQGISGATYTVQGFTTSVQDAMAQAGI